MIISPSTKNGPKGIVSPDNLFFPHKISMIETIEPVKNAMYKEIINIGNPEINPKTNENFTSPNPIPRPLVIRKSAKKKAKDINAAKRWFRKSPLINKIKDKPQNTRRNRTTLSGIMPCLISAKNITNKSEATINR